MPHLIFLSLVNFNDAYVYLFNDNQNVFFMGAFWNPLSSTNDFVIIFLVIDTSQGVCLDHLNEDDVLFHEEDCL